MAEEYDKLYKGEVFGTIFSDWFPRDPSRSDGADDFAIDMANAPFFVRMVRLKPASEEGAGDSAESGET